MEIERKYLIHTIPFDLSSFPFRTIEQGYLCTNPVVRIRKDNDRYELTYKSRGMMIREEHNLPLTAEGYEHLKTKIDGICIEKTRFFVFPLVLTHLQVQTHHGLPALPYQFPSHRSEP